MPGNSLKRRALVAAVCLMCAVAGSASADQFSAAELAKCNDDMAQRIADAAKRQHDVAKQAYQDLVPQPANLSDSSCFGDILNMGLNIGGSLFDPSAILSAMKQAACSAAKNAIQWPIQNALNRVSGATQLPYGLGGVSASTNNSGQVTASTSSTGAASTGLPGAVSNSIGNTSSNYLNVLK